MLKIDLRNEGNEYYIKKYQKDDFNEEQFLEEHEDDYHELEIDNTDMLMWLEDVQVFVYLNDEEVFSGTLEEDEKFKLIDNEVKSWREFVNAKEDETVVMWEHDGNILQSFIFNNVTNFQIDNLQILTGYFPDNSGNKDKIFLGLVYDGKDCDENELEFEPGMGFSGPDIY